MQVTLSEAAVYLKMSERTVRRWLHSGKLQGSQVPTDRGFQWMVDLPAGIPVDTDGQVSSELQSLRDMNALLIKRLELADQELEARRREVQELHVLLQQAQSALPAPQDNHSWWKLWRRA